MLNISAQFREALGRPVQETRSRIEILDDAFTPIHVIGGGGLDKGLLDGVVDLDVGRGTRRTLVTSLLNENGEFSPTSQWGGLFYVNRLIRLSRGLVINQDQTEYIPIGTFMVDKTETIVERGLSTIVISGSDLWKKFSKSQFVDPRTFAAYTPINTIISTLATEAGVTSILLDPLSSRTSASKNIQVAVNYEKGETRGDAIFRLCAAHAIDVFFNPMGVLVTEEFRNPLTRAPVWQYGYGAEPNRLAYLIRSTTDDDRLYNHVHVTGTGNPDTIYSADVKDTDPLSPTNITRIGDRVYRMESGVLASQAAVDLAANSLFYSVNLLGQTVGIEAICNPALEGNDVVEIVEPTYSQTTAKFLINTLSVPLLSGKQKMDMKRVINLAT